jgi:acyl carrier protein
MDRTELTEALTAALNEVLKRDLPELTDQTRLFEDLHLDSTSILELLMAIEDTVGIEVDPESLDMSHFATFGSLAGYVSGRLAVTAA